MQPSASVARKRKRQKRRTTHLRHAGHVLGAALFFASVAFCALTMTRHQEHFSWLALLLGAGWAWAFGASAR